MKDTRKVTNEGENIPHIGGNIRYFRKKMKQKEGKPNQTQFAAILSEMFQKLVYKNLSDEYKKEYDELKDKEISQQLISDWELGTAETPKLIAFLAAQFFNLDVKWLTDYIFETFESPGYVQTGGSSINYWNTIHTQTVEIKNDPEPLVDGFRGLMQTQKEYYEDILKKEK